MKIFKIKTTCCSFGEPYGEWLPVVHSIVYAKNYKKAIKRFVKKYEKREKENFPYEFGNETTRSYGRVSVKDVSTGFTKYYN